MAGDSRLDTTPPRKEVRLEWVGRVLGMDLFVDTAGHPDHDRMRDMAEALLYELVRGRENDD